MAVYIDELRVWGPGKGRTCHMTADTVAELHAFARKHGIPDRYRHRGASVPHYDLGPKWRQWAEQHGAEFVPAREQARRRLVNRGALAAGGEN